MGAKVKETRKALGLKQQELADALSVHKITLSNYERGAQGVPMDVIQKLAELSGRPLAWFFLSEGQRLTEDREPTPPESLTAIRSHLDNLERELAKQGSDGNQESVSWSDERVHRLLTRAAESGKVPTLHELRMLRNISLSESDFKKSGDWSELAAMDRKKKGGKQKDVHAEE